MNPLVKQMDLRKGASEGFFEGAMRGNFVGIIEGIERGNTFGFQLHNGFLYSR